MKVEIYQVKKDLLQDFGFLSYEDAIYHNGVGSVRMDNYDAVYECEIQSSDDMTLDELYYIFNEVRPEDFRGHSMSVSDVVKVDDVCWYCDDIGWKKLDWRD